MRQLPSLSPVLHAVIRANRTRAALPDLERTALAFPVPGPDGMRWTVWLNAPSTSSVWLPFTMPSTAAPIRIKPVAASPI